MRSSNQGTQLKHPTYYRTVKGNNKYQRSTGDTTSEYAYVSNIARKSTGAEMTQHYGTARHLPNRLSA